MTVAVAETEQRVFRGFEHLDLDAAPIIHLSEAPELIPELEIDRLLTEVDHLQTAMDEKGCIPEVIEEDVKTNLQTALAEISMPYAVTRTAHKVELAWDAEEQRMQRTFQWLGRCAVGVAESGYEFHFSEAAKKRVAIEVAEATHAQESLQPGKVQFFVSPRMTRSDASEIVAKEEHLHEEDSIRASYLIIDRDGTETHRIMESLLIRDVPLDAWVAMLEDENNIFGKSIEVTDKSSALGIMETFAELELPQTQASEGPVTLVEAVIPYIEDKALQLSAQLQLEGFRNDQNKYTQQAKVHGAEWYDFELELATSLKWGESTPLVTEFIKSVASLWSVQIQDEFKNHYVGDRFMMTRELSALVEKAKRNIIATKAAVKTGNENVIEQIDVHTVALIQNHSNQYVPGSMQNRELERSIVSQNVEVSGGCSGSACGLETVTAGSNEDAWLRKELGAEAKDTVTKDKVRTCECGEKGIIYAHNASKVIKMCQSCGKKETKYTKAKAA